MLLSYPTEVGQEVRVVFFVVSITQSCYNLPQGFVSPLLRHLVVIFSFSLRVLLNCMTLSCIS